MSRRSKSTKDRQPTETLKGWKAIGAYLGIGTAAAHRWAQDGMPVRREGRFTVADVDDIRNWLGREAHMPKPAYLLTGKADVVKVLKDSISALPRPKRDMSK